MALQINEKKFARQQAGTDRWKTAKELGLSHRNGWGTLYWATGVGKTFATYTICNKMLEKNNSHIIYIVVPSIFLEEQWNIKLKDFVKPEYHSNFVIITVHKVMKYIDDGKFLRASLFVFDEIHEYYSKDRLRMFSGQYIDTRWALGLTATYEDKDNRHFEIAHILPIVDRIDEEEAEREGFISKFVEYNLSVSFNERERQLYDEQTEIMTRNLSKFGKGGLKLASKIIKEPSIATRYAEYNGWSRDLDLSIEVNRNIHSMWNPKVIIGYAVNSMDAIRQRKNIVYCAMNKLLLAKEIAIKFENLKTIFFSQSTAFADALARAINQHYEKIEGNGIIPCVVYHSKLSTQIITDPITGKEKKKGKTVLKREAIEAINSDRASRISTASSLDRGSDIDRLCLGVTTSGTQNPTQTKQRNGRTLRFKEGMITLIINLYIKKSIDEKWLRSRQSKSTTIIYWINSINEISYTPINNEVFNLKEI